MKSSFAPCVVFVLLACICRSCGEDAEATTTAPATAGSPENPSIEARKLWIKSDHDLKSGMAKMIRRAMPTLMKEIYKKDVSASCIGALMGFAKALRETKLWAFKMLDACGRFPEGFLYGTLTSMGNYEECLDIRVDEKKMKLQGQYCTLQLLPPMPAWKPFSSAHLILPELVNVSGSDTVVNYLMSFIHNLHVTTVKIGLCTPSKCSVEDIDKLVDIIPEQIGLNWNFKVSECDIRRGIEFTNPQMAVFYILAMVVLLVLAGSLADKVWSAEEMEKKCVRSAMFYVVTSFSFFSNAKKLSNYTCPQSELRFVYGIFFIVFCWNVIANTFMFVNYDVASNFVEALNLLRQLFYEIALNRVLPLQTIFYLSGFISTYRWMKSPEKNLNVVKFLLKKYWRYTPAYALVIAVLITAPNWGSGPSWGRHMNPMYENCKNNWWYNILYINNFMDSSKVCLTHTWVFAVSAQLQIIGAIILFLLKFKPKIGLLFNFVLAAASLASVALTNVYYDLPPNEMAAMLSEKDRRFYAEHSYYRLYTHVCMYCIGVFVGYLMVKYPNLKISWKTACFMWIVTGTALLSALCTVHEWRVGRVPSSLMSSLYTTFSKVAEAGFLAWFTVACIKKLSGGVTEVLCWRPFAFLARLSFIAYTIHVPLMNMVMSYKRSHIFICELEIFYIVLSHATASYIISYVFYLFFEAPWISLTDFLSRRCKERTFTTEIDQKPITEKPVKCSEKVHFQNTNSINTMEKGQC